MSDNQAQLSRKPPLCRPAGADQDGPVALGSLANPLASTPRRSSDVPVTGADSAASEDFDYQGTLVVDQHFAIVPEWIIDADISDCAYRLYSILLRYGQTSGQRMPGRALLAQRLKKRSTDTVDRALKELVAIGAVGIERRRRGRQNLTNRYHLMQTPAGTRPVLGRSRRMPGPAPGMGGRNAAATPPGRTSAATGTPIAAATPAAPVRPDPGVPTQRTPPPPSPAPPAAHPTTGGAGGNVGTVTPGARRRPPGVPTDLVEDVDTLAARCQQLRRRLGLPVTRWTARRLAEVLREAITVHGWPAEIAGAALMAIAADPATNSPMRLACPGPWWDTAEQPTRTNHHDPATDVELDELEARLTETDGLRVTLQRQARHQLAAEGCPVTRLTVSRRATELLEREAGPAS